MFSCSFFLCARFSRRMGFLGHFSLQKESLSWATTTRGWQCWKLGCSCFPPPPPRLLNLEKRILKGIRKTSYFEETFSPKQKVSVEPAFRCKPIVQTSATVVLFDARSLFCTFLSIRIWTLDKQKWNLFTRKGSCSFYSLFEYFSIMLQLFLSISLVFIHTVLSEKCADAHHDCRLIAVKCLSPNRIEQKLMEIACPLTCGYCINSKTGGTTTSTVPTDEIIKPFKCIDEADDCADRANFCQRKFYKRMMSLQWVFVSFFSSSKF